MSLDELQRTFPGQTLLWSQLEGFLRSAANATINRQGCIPLAPRIPGTDNPSPSSTLCAGGRSVSDLYLFCAARLGSVRLGSTSPKSG